MTMLQPFTCTIRVFDPISTETIAEYALPVNSPDAEHAVASTLANAASFTSKMADDMKVRSVAFTCTKVERRT